MYTRRAVILAKIESTYGTDPTPTGASNAVLTSKPDIKIVSEKLDRDFVSSTLSPLAPQVVLQTWEINFDVEARASSAAGTPPEVGALLRACGMSETIVASTSVTYAPVSEDFESATIYAYFDGIRVKLLGCRGNMKISGEVGKYGIYSFTMRGLWAVPTDTTLATPTYSGQLPEVVRDGTISITPSGGSLYNPVAVKFGFDLQNEIFRRDDITEDLGVKEIMIAGRKPTCTLDLEAVPLATFDFWSKFQDRTSCALVCAWGDAGADNKIRIDAPTAVIDDIALGEKGPLMAHTVPFICAYDSGDDEISILYK